MTYDALKTFFMWNSIIHIAIMLLWLGIMKIAPDFFRKQQGFWFPVSKENFHSINYQFFGFYKLAILIFSAVPYIVLLMMGSSD